MRELRSLAGVAVVSLFLSAPASTAQTYRVTDLGEAGGYGQGNAVNRCGQVGGFVNNIWPVVGFFWGPHTGLIKLRSLHGAVGSQANGINTSGVLAGYALNGSGESHAVTWTQGRIRDFGTLPGDIASGASAINDRGDLVGTSTGYGVYHAFLWTQDKGMQDLGTLPGGYESSATAINRSRTVVGGVDIGQGEGRGFVWTERTGMRELPALPTGGHSGANSLNDHSQIVGNSDVVINGHYYPDRAVLWNKAHKIESLGTLPGTTSSVAFAINNNGEVVGFSGWWRAMIWTRAKGMQNLNDLIPQNLGWILLEAFAINDRGQITGEGTLNGQPHAFLLTPTHESNWGCH